MSYLPVPSPFAHDGFLYLDSGVRVGLAAFCMSEEGDTFVIRAGEEFELLGTNPLEEFTMATPAIVGDRLLIRTMNHLYSIRKTPEI